jgi:hypothetical protein
MLLSLSSVSDGLPDMSISEFAEMVANAAEATGDEKLRGPREQWNALRERLERLLAPGNPLALSAKAAGLFTEQERLFCDARILTDIRPVFERQATVRPAGLSVIHTLKLLFHKTSQNPEELYIALDVDDLRTLKQVIQRAEEKQQSLEAVVRSTGIPLLSAKYD